LKNRKQTNDSNKYNVLKVCLSQKIADALSLSPPHHKTSLPQLTRICQLLSFHQTKDLQQL
jgi:hypothetical protein